MSTETLEEDYNINVCITLFDSRNFDLIGFTMKVLLAIRDINVKSNYLIMIDRQKKIFSSFLQLSHLIDDSHTLVEYEEEKKRGNIFIFNLPIVDWR